MKLRLLAYLLTVAAASTGSAQDDAASCISTTIELHGVATKKPVTITYHLETATTPEARETGLMNRESIGACDGMTFFFPKSAPQKFWMKNTHIPLDILFIDEQGKILQITQGTPESLALLGPDTPIRSVIEIAGGRAASDKITVGDEVRYEVSSTDLLVR